ncbi:MAG: mitochondrial fission ELM1 family protein [Ahrensia sp.]|nr:mitochondrial fission ELM1 family protein [Ahrensia sp.]
MTLDADILILSDGKMGDLAQCRGVAHHLAAPGRVREHVVKPTGFWALPVPFMPVAPLERRSSIFEAPLPDIVIASGRRTIAHMRAFSKMRERPFTVFLKDPRQGRNLFDFIWAPEHDELAGANVMTTLTSPHTLSSQRLMQVRAEVSERLSLSAPVTGIVLGGDTAGVQWTDSAAVQFALTAKNIVADSTPIVVSSRRTPDCLVSALDTAFPDAIWPERAGFEEPYLTTLAVSDGLIVTGDSHNMVSEALATSAAVYVFRPQGLRPKLSRFLDAALDQGHIVELSDAMHAGSAASSREPLNATPAIAAEIEGRFLASQPS